MFDYVAVTEYKTPQITSTTKECGDLIQIFPQKETPHDSVPLRDDVIKPGIVNVLWVPELLQTPLKPDRYICLHFHGGAFVTLSPGQKQVQTGPRILAAELGVPVLMVDYRLSCNPGCRFPAAFQDAVTAYKYVVRLAGSSAKILLSGDSAGANLVLALLRYISENTNARTHEEPAQLPSPGGAALWSPWVDLTDAGIDVAASTNASSDYLTKSLLLWGAREYVPRGMDRDSRYLSPGRHPFDTRVPLYVHFGSAEVLLAQQRAFVKMYREVVGNDIKSRETPAANHDIFAAGWDLGFGQEQKEICKEAVRFLCH